MQAPKAHQAAAPPRVDFLLPSPRVEDIDTAWGMIRKSVARLPKRSCSTKQAAIVSLCRLPLWARVAELVDAHDSKSCSARSGGSIPSTGTNFSMFRLYSSLFLH